MGILREALFQLELRAGVFQLEFALLVILGIVMIAKKVKLKKWLFNMSFGLYLSLLIAICFFPIRIDGSMDESVANNFIPLKGIINSISESVRDSSSYGLTSVIGNFVMLMPLGLYYNFYIKNMKSRLVGILLFSISIEAIQFIIGLLIGYNYRCIDIDDVILNTLGGIIACLCVNLAMKKYAKKKKSHHSV